MADHYESIEADIISLEKQASREPSRQMDSENDNVSECKRKIAPAKPKYIHSVRSKFNVCYEYLIKISKIG